MKWLKLIKNDVSTGTDNLPSKFIKLVYEDICSPLTFIINSCIMKNKFPNAWKLSRVTPLPKIQNPIDVTHYRPISILPALSKVFEKIVLEQMLEFIDQQHVYKDTLSGFRKGFSTGSL